MPYSMTQLTDSERDAFIKDNYWGVLSFAGEEPYAIPVGYQYIKGDILLGFGPTGRKQGYVEKSRNVCLVICRPSKLSSDSKESYPFTTIIIDGELEDVTDRSYYGLPPLPEGVKVGFYKLNQKVVGTQNLSWSD
jgi:nitroimidazol reductase NimA-like FMN-containing flavoprotein (pyridoxamine 5'-phosphate oxidase superfamily)